MSPQGVRQLFASLLAALLLAAACQGLASRQTGAPTYREGSEVSAEGALAYVFNVGSGEVSVIDTAKNELLRTEGIEGVKKFGWVDESNHFDGQNLWVGNLDPETGEAEVLLLNLGTLEVTGSIPVGTEKANIFVSRATQDGERVFVSLLQTGEVVVIETSTQQVTQRIPANKIACDVDLGKTTEGQERVFVPNRDADTLQAIDPQSLEVLQTAQAPKGTWPWMLTLSPDGRYVWVQDAKGNTNTVWDAQTLEIVKHIPTGNNPSVGIFTPDGSEVYAGHLDDSKVVVIDAQSFQSLATIQVGTNPVIIGFRPDGRYAYVTVNKEGGVAVIDTESRQVVKRIEVGEMPMGIYVRGSRPPGT